MQVDVKIPDAEGVEEFILTYWHYKEGDLVKKGSDLLEVASEKAIFNIPSPVEGKLISIKFQEGDTLKAEDVVATIQKCEVK